jgi:hypothetical protein
MENCAMTNITFESYFAEEYLSEAEVDWYIEQSYKSLPPSVDRKHRYSHIINKESSRNFFVNYLNLQKGKRPTIILGDWEYSIRATELVTNKNLDKFATLLLSMEDHLDSPSTMEDILTHDGLFELIPIRKVR